MTRRPVRLPGVPVRLRRDPVPWAHQRPTWPQARPALIAGALDRALRRPHGNWYVVGASRDVPAGVPLGRTVEGTEIVLWRDASGTLTAGPGACPHLGAPGARTAAGPAARAARTAVAVGPPPPRQRPRT
ncbi:Rieske (2Fe-2S) protein, partial [Streptomyces sp. NPDC002454]